MATNDPWYSSRAEAEKAAQELVEAHGYTGYSIKERADGTLHITCYNEVHRASFDMTPSGEYKPETPEGLPSYHEMDTQFPKEKEE